MIAHGATKTPVEDRRPDSVCSSCPFVLGFIFFLPSPVRWQRPRVKKKKVCNSTTLPKPMSPLRNTPHCKLPPNMLEAHTATQTRLWKDEHPFCIGVRMTGGQWEERSPHQLLHKHQHPGGGGSYFYSFKMLGCVCVCVLGGLEVLFWKSSFQQEEKKSSHSATRAKAKLVSTGGTPLI